MNLLLTLPFFCVCDSPVPAGLKPGGGADASRAAAGTRFFVVVFFLIHGHSPRCRRRLEQMLSAQWRGGSVLAQAPCDTHIRTHVWRTEEFVSRRSPGRQLCSDVLIIHISSLLINDPSVPSRRASSSKTATRLKHSNNKRSLALVQPSLGAATKADVSKSKERSRPLNS